MKIYVLFPLSVLLMSGCASTAPKEISYYDQCVLNVEANYQQGKITKEQHDNALEKLREVYVKVMQENPSPNNYYHPTSSEPVTYYNRGGFQTESEHQDRMNAWKQKQDQEEMSRKLDQIQQQQRWNEMQRQNQKYY